MPYQYEKYVCSVDTLQETIDKYGVAIIPGVLNAEECNKLKTQTWDTLEKLTSTTSNKFDRGDAGTWRSFYELFPLHSMLVQHHGIGHNQALWDVRQNPKVVDVFAKFWGVDQRDLLVSFDGMSVHLPPEITNKGWLSRQDPPLHTDQSFLRNDFECIQSWVTAYDVNEGDATLQFLEKSNSLHKKFADHFGKTDKDDWYKLDDHREYEWYYSNGCERTSIKCKAGDMVLWDSRTIHAGQEAVRGRSKANIRIVAYVCMQPRAMCSEAMLKKKLNAFENKRTTNHWPCKIKLFPLQPRTYGKELGTFAELDPPILTPLGKRLAGFD
jgi:hypothetical protein